MFTNAYNNVTRVFAAIGSWFGARWTEIKTALAAVPQWFGTQFQNAWTNIKNAFANVTSFFSGLWDKIKGCFVDVGVKIGSAVGDAFKSAINSCLATIEGVVNKFIRMINGVIGIINEIPGVSLGSIGELSLPRLAKGGVLREGTAMVAEAGPELLSMVNGKAVVTPLTGSARNRSLENTGSGKGGYSQTINISSPKALSPYEVARQTRLQTRSMILAVQRGVNEVSDIKVICTSDKNVSITFTWDEFTPFHLVDIEGIYGIEANVVTSENTTTDGSTYQGATAKERNIVLTVEMDGNYRENRNLLYRTFPIKRTGNMQYIEDGEAKTIEYEVESIIPGATTGVVRDYTISLKCTDPYFKDLADIEVVMASWVSDFYFPACFPEEGRIFGHREADLVKEIENDSGADNIGIVVIFRADGAVKNPAIYHAESGEFTKVGYLDNDFTMASGQYVIINTYTGKKNVYLLDGVTQAEIESYKNAYGVIDWDTVIEKFGTVINEYLDEDGDFIQLQDGTNTLTYSADEGTNYLSVSVYYRISYLGV